MYNQLIGSQNELYKEKGLKLEEMKRFCVMEHTDGALMSQIIA